MKQPKHILTLMILILQTVLLSSASNDHILKAKSFNKEKNGRLFHVQTSYPEIPPRPTLHELSKTVKPIDDLDHKYSFANDFIQSNEDIKEIITSDKSFESLFLISPDNLFLLTIRAVMALNLSFKKVNVAKKEIIVLDKFRNKLVIDVFGEHDKSTIKIYGYKSLLGKIALEHTVRNVIDKISEFNNEQIIQ